MPRIVHLGLGNFHRAHQAWYVQHAGGWQITGVVMSNQQQHNELLQSNHQYILGLWGNDGLRTETISVYDDIMLATEQSGEIIERIADIDTHIVSLTVTEKGYYLTADGSGLDVNAQRISEDLLSTLPTTAIGLLSAGIAKRALKGIRALTVLSCDNLADNGDKLQQAVSDFMTEKYPEAIAWMAQRVSFPNSMVDRITPRLADAAKAEIRAIHAQTTLPVVGSEAFSEWIITDQFVSPRPDWEYCGVELVADVAAFEERKLRMLNASHSYLAYSGQLSGYRFVHEAIADDALRTAVSLLWDEAALTVSEPAARSLNEYRAALLSRFAVPEMRHELKQIAMDGSVKLPERLVPIMIQRSRVNLDSPNTCVAIAAWMIYVCKTIATDQTLEDPNEKRLQEIVDQSHHPSSLIEQLAQLIGLPQTCLPQLPEKLTADIEAYL